ncbi:MAG: phosphotransferase [Sedimentisphaerales bacterium]|nr:phosphotransferase [Sedimentisphaerales bacterium]
MGSDYISAQWQALFAGWPEEVFSTLWTMELAALDKANSARQGSGWSRPFVWRCEMPDGRVQRFIVKRQQDYNSAHWRHPLRGVPTLEKEFRNIRRYQQLGIPTVEPVYFARRRCEGHDRAVLVTEFLEGFQPLNVVLDSGGPPPPERRRKDIIEAVAGQVRRLHRARLRHRHLQVKHILVRLNPLRIDVCFIDLEATRRRPLGPVDGRRDLVTLNRSARGMGAADRLRFIHAYLGTDRLDNRTRRLCSAIRRRTAAKTAAKQRRRPAPPATGSPA